MTNKEDMRNGVERLNGMLAGIEELEELAKQLFAREKIVVREGLRSVRGTLMWIRGTFREELAR